jgi:endogenous inhibitor of DNA gyrase (YacG/DUF329 family)
MIVTCTHCGIEVKKNPSKVKNNNFCSLSCKNKNQKTSVAIRCVECGIEIEKKLSNYSKYKNNFCSRSCSDKNKKTSVVVNCTECGVEVERRLSDAIRYKNIFCSPSCRNKNQKTSVVVRCKECGVEVERRLSDAIKYKNNFCCRSCSSKYSNRHKTYGFTRSKLEKWLEKKLNNLYPELDVHYCKRDAIGMELDIYIPSIGTGFEFNGPTHYIPIYGESTFKSIKARDAKRRKLCRKNKIKLIEVDVSTFKFNKNKVDALNHYLGLVTKAIEGKLKTSNKKN